MSLFIHIENLGIPIEDLAAITEQDIIRIEKKLKAQVRIDNTLDANDVAKIVHALRNDKRHIIKLYQEDFKALLRILKDKLSFVHVPEYQMRVFTFEADFIRFLGSNFDKVLYAYANRCLKAKHYYGLYSLLCYHSVLSAELLQMIGQKLEQILDSTTEFIRLEADQIEVKTEAVANPFLYRCLNLLVGIQFETKIGSLLKMTLKTFEMQQYKMLILFALGEFKATSLSLGKEIERHRQIAEAVGAYEIIYMKGQPKGKGGTVIDPLSSPRKLETITKETPKEIIGTILVLALVIIAFYAIFIRSE